MNKVIFLDRDGTINIDYGYVHTISDFEFIPGVIEGLKNLTKMGFLLIVITNQSGIGRKMYTKDDFLKLNDYMIDELKKNDINISKVYYCPHIDENKCDCRKPKIGLFKKAIKEFNIDLNKSYAIGDNERDLSICDLTNVNGILLSKKSNKYHYEENFLDAVKYIENNIY